MRYFIFKSTLISSIILFVLMSCGVDKVSGNLNYGYYVGVISFNKNKKESFITQYDQEGNETNRVKFSLEGMSYLGEFIKSDKNNFYVKSNDIVSNKGKSYLIKVDKYTNRYSKIDLNLGDLYKIFVLEDEIYITHSLNKLSIYDNKLDKIIRTEKFDDYITDEFYIDDENVYLFSRNGNKASYLNILDRHDLSIIDKFDITRFGLYQNDMFYYDGKIYFTNYNTNNNSNSGKIGIYDVFTKTFDYLNTSSNNLDKIFVDENKIYVTIRGDNNNINKDSVIVINKLTKDSKKFELDYSIKVFDISNDKIYILSDRYLDIYNVEDFSLYKKIKIDLEEDSVVSGIILYDY